MRVLLIDNYDSFTYNLYHYTEPFCKQLDVVYNDQLDLSVLSDYDQLLISPGPGLPEDAGFLMQVLNKWDAQKPVLGVCLGLQAIVEYYGGTLRNLEQVYHGKSENCYLDTSAKLFKGLPLKIKVGRYHSWVAEEALPVNFKVTARDENKLVMAIEHTDLPWSAVQFHPESIMTEHGKEMIRNWLH